MLGGGAAGLDLLVGGGEDVLGLLLGQREDLLHPGAEMPEGRPVDDRRMLAQLGQVALQHLDLTGQLVDLGVRLFPFGRERGDLVLRTSDVSVDLSFLVPPQGGLEAGLRGHVPAEREQFLAVRHAPILTRIGPSWGDTDAVDWRYFTRIAAGVGRMTA